MSSPDDILEFWFGTGTDPWRADPDKTRLWFGGGPEVDAEIARRFGEDLEKASRGELDGWAATARGRLALVILLDQFSRNLFRQRPRAFAQDARALKLAIEGVAAGEDQELRPVERTFLYLPFEHSEDLAQQERGVGLFRRLQAEAPAEVAAGFAQATGYAVRHRDIIAKFGRFPHRNQTLGRPSTEAEVAFLATPGSSFRRRAALADGTASRVNC